MTGKRKYYLTWAGYIMLVGALVVAAFRLESGDLASFLSMWVLTSTGLGVGHHAANAAEHKFAVKV